MNWFEKFLSETGFSYVLMRMAVILLLTLFAVKLFGAAAKRFWPRTKIHHKFFYSLTVIIIYFIGFILFFSQIPSFDSGIATLLTGSGIAALILGLAAQEALGNALNGMTITFSKPFEVGDRISLVGRGITGYIENITLRHTVIRTFNNSRIIVPNSVINKELIENADMVDNKASGFIDATITYDSDLDKASGIISKAITEHPYYLGEDTPPKVYVRGLSPYGVELRASIWTKDVNTNFDACSDVRRRIKSEFDQAGIAFAQYVLPEHLPPH
ncbi:MAG: mechanosensitive ion channel family protein [Oscillospiraceae bacterium]|jgi:small-conductance mechanosensitive channel|nr:mechanosensitive ion channel family protein [Oscillospiraceae bacterium]